MTGRPSYPLSVFKQRGSGFYMYQEDAGVISPEACWVCVCEGYLYTGNTFEELVKTLNNEWKHDKHLVG